MLDMTRVLAGPSAATAADFVRILEDRITRAGGGAVARPAGLPRGVCVLCEALVQDLVADLLASLLREREHALSAGHQHGSPLSEREPSCS